MEDLLATRQSERFLSTLLACAVAVACLLAGAAITSLLMGVQNLVTALLSPMFIYASLIGLGIVLAAGALFMVSVTLPPQEN